MGSKAQPPEQQPIILPPAPEPVEPIIFSFPEPAPYPEIPPYPEIRQEPVKDFREEELKAANVKRQKKADKLRKGRQSTIKTSPLGDDEEANIRKQTLLGY